MLIQDMSPITSRGRMESTSDYVVDADVYSNFYQPSLYPYYNNLYNYSPYQMAMGGDPAAAGDIGAISGSSMKNSLRSISVAYVPEQAENQWQIKSNDNLLVGLGTSSQYRMHSYYPSYLGQNMATPACVPPVITLEENPNFLDAKASVFSPHISQDCGLVSLSSSSPIINESTKGVPERHAPSESSSYSVPTVADDME